MNRFHLLQDIAETWDNEKDILWRDFKSRPLCIHLLLPCL